MLFVFLQKKEDIKHMAYWLSFTSTLFFLIQKTLSPAPHKPQQPTSLFGRMTQVHNILSFSLYFIKTNGYFLY